MKRIKFDNIQANWFFISLIVVSLICLMVGSFELIPFENPSLIEELVLLASRHKPCFSQELSGIKIICSGIKKECSFA